MGYGIILLLELIKEKTGKDVRVYSDFGETFYTLTDGETVDKAEYKINGIVSDSLKHKTYFRFMYKTESMVGYIDGDGEAEKTYAGLITALFENGVVKESTAIKEESLKSILLGNEQSANIKKYMNKFKVAEKPCVVYAVINSKPHTSADVLNFLRHFGEVTSDMACITDENALAYIRFLDSPITDTEQSVTEFAYIISQSVYEELGVGVKIGVGGTVSGFEECAISYRQAMSAVKTSEIFTENSPVSTYKEYVLFKMLEDMPKYKLQEILDVLLDPESKKIFSDEEILSTADEFFYNDLNVSETSRKLYMHRNTLMYRLDKIERETGLDIRKFKDALTFKIITVIHKILGNYR